jgi:hypothetical protein
VGARFEENIEIYNKILETIIATQKFVKIVRKNQRRKIANCKLLGNRIMKFAVIKIKNQIKENLLR